jgi:hypothetical protein
LHFHAIGGVRVARHAAAHAAAHAQADTAVHRLLLPGRLLLWMLLSWWSPWWEQQVHMEHWGESIVPTLPWRPRAVVPPDAAADADADAADAAADGVHRVRRC